jgi:hypothetical protein
LMAVCGGTKRDGSRCTATVEPPQSYCWWHDPANAEERRRAASKGGRARASRELAGVKTLLAGLTNRVLKVEGAEDLETGRAAVANQLINTRLRAIEVERKVKETDELEKRIEALERGQAGGRRWGA